MARMLAILLQVTMVLSTTSHARARGMALVLSLVGRTGNSKRRSIHVATAPGSARISDAIIPLVLAFRPLFPQRAPERARWSLISRALVPLILCRRCRPAPSPSTPVRHHPNCRPTPQAPLPVVHRPICRLGPRSLLPVMRHPTCHPLPQVRPLVPHHPM